jgi:type II secretory pathway pseudopilin PulG
VKFFHRNKELVMAVLVAVITLIGSIGLYLAPSKASDQSAQNLEKELQANEAMLQQEQDRKQQEQQEQPEEETQETDMDFVTFVGDSVGLGAAPNLLEQIPGSVVDAKESRQARDGISILQELEQANQLGNTVVIELGTNGYFSQQTGQDIIDYLGKDRQIYWVCVYGRYLQDQQRINDMIRTLVDDNQNLSVIDWDQTAAQNPDWFYDDGIHLNGAGREGFANLVRESLGLPLPDTESGTVEFTMPEIP